MEVNIRLRDLSSSKECFYDYATTIEMLLRELNSFFNSSRNNVSEALKPEFSEIIASYNDTLKELIKDLTSYADYLNGSIRNYKSVILDATKSIEDVLSKMNSCYLVSDVARETAKGSFGAGFARIKNLEEFGYDPKSVQKMVNSKYYAGKISNDSGGLFESTSITPYQGKTYKRMVLEDMNLSTTPPRSLVYEAQPVPKTSDNISSNNSSFDKAEEMLQIARTGGISALAKSENRTARVVAGVLTGGASSVIYSNNPTARTATAIATGGMSVAANSPNPYVRVGTAIATGGTSLLFKR